VCNGIITDFHFAGHFILLSEQVANSLHHPSCVASGIDPIEDAGTQEVSTAIP
jgi:hypothetical protein